MRREPGEMWATMASLSEALVPGADPSGRRELADRLMVQLQEHNGKEEVIVYPAGEQMIPPALLDELAAQLPGVVVPPGWVCRAAR